MNNHIAISIIVPVYNVADYLHYCIDSIATQTFTDFECLLVDDGSTDNSGKICDQYAEKDQRFRVIHKTNGGLSDARNTGIQQAHGAYIAFVDGDDWIATDMLKNLYRHAIKYDLDVACGNVKLFDNTTHETKDYPALQAFCPDDEIVSWKNLENNISDALFNCCVCSKLYKREVFEHHNFPKGRKYEDIIFWSEIFFSLTRIGCITDTVYYYRINRAGSIVTEHDYSDYPNALEIMFKKLSSHGIYSRCKADFIAMTTLRFIQAINNSMPQSRKGFFCSMKKLFCDMGHWCYTGRYSFILNVTILFHFVACKKLPYFMYSSLFCYERLLRNQKVNTFLRKTFIRLPKKQQASNK